MNFQAVLRNVTIDDVVSLLCKLVCTVGALYWVYVLMCKYQLNLDSSQISIKEFDGFRFGEYPSFTICLTSDYGGIFSKEVLQKYYGISSEVFWGILTGEITDINSTMARVNFPETLIRVEDFVEKVISVNDSSFSIDECSKAFSVISINRI